MQHRESGSTAQQHSTYRTHLGGEDTAQTWHAAAQRRTAQPRCRTAQHSTYTKNRTRTWAAVVPHWRRSPCQVAAGAAVLGRKDRAVPPRLLNQPGYRTAPLRRRTANFRGAKAPKSESARVRNPAAVHGRGSLPEPRLHSCGPMHGCSTAHAHHCTACTPFQGTAAAFPCTTSALMWPQLMAQPCLNPKHPLPLDAKTCLHDVSLHVAPIHGTIVGHARLRANWLLALRSRG